MRKINGGILQVWADVFKDIYSFGQNNFHLKAIQCIVYALFAGPWSDLHGRKFLIICSSVGFIIINTYWFYQLKAEYLLFEFLQVK